MFYRWKILSHSHYNQYSWRINYNFDFFICFTILYIYKIKLIKLFLKIILFLYIFNQDWSFIQLFSIFVYIFFLKLVSTDFLYLIPKQIFFFFFFALMNSSMYREAPNHKFKAFEIIFSKINNWSCNLITFMSKDTICQSLKFSILQS